ncbi:MAG: hypothetical protein ACLP0B_21280 [Steroidobacteraceae bacterium]
MKEEFFRHAAGEDSPGSPSGTLANQAIMESAMNRAAMRGTSLAAQLGYFQGYSSFNGNQRAIMEDNLNKVLGGSDVSGGATDNSSGGLAARERASGKFRFIKEINRESFFSPGWGEPNWQRRYPLFLAEEERKRFARQPLPNMGIVGGDRDLLQQGRRSGLFGGMRHEVTGSAGVVVDFRGMPRGVRIAGSIDGGLFKQIKLNRGVAMPLASQDG